MCLENRLRDSLIRIAAAKLNLYDVFFKIDEGYINFICIEKSHNNDL